MYINKLLTIFVLISLVATAFAYEPIILNPNKEHPKPVLNGIYKFNCGDVEMQIVIFSIEEFSEELFLERASIKCQDKITNIINPEGKTAVLESGELVFKQINEIPSNDYYCMDTGIKMECDSLSDYNALNLRTRCYYYDYEESRERYKMCYTGWNYIEPKLQEVK